MASIITHYVPSGVSYSSTAFLPSFTAATASTSTSDATYYGMDYWCQPTNNMGKLMHTSTSVVTTTNTEDSSSTTSTTWYTQSAFNVGYTGYTDELAIRPCITFTATADTYQYFSESGNTFTINNNKFTVYKPTTSSSYTGEAILTGDIGKCAYTNNYSASAAYSYPSSLVKKKIDKWAETALA